MPRLAHLAAGVVAPLCIAVFFVASVLVELCGSPAAIAQLKAWIVTPGLWILIPALAATGGSGTFLARSRRGRLVDAKRKRMAWIAANGLLVLLPSALLLDHWAAAGEFGAAFVAVQALELAAGALNLALIGLNFRDGLRLSGRLRGAPRPAPQA